MSVINTNYLALVSQNNLTKSQGALGTAIERLSSGLRINSAKDDAAGQAIANRFTANIKGLTQASRNANDGISIAQTTEGALNEINNNLQRIRELSVQAANGSNSETDRISIQAEIQQRLDEIDRVSAQTQFNGTNVLAKDGELTIQVGAKDNETISINLQAITSSTLKLGNLDVRNSGFDTSKLEGLTAQKLSTEDLIETTAKTVASEATFKLNELDFNDTNGAPTLSFEIHTDATDTTKYYAYDGTDYYDVTVNTTTNTFEFELASKSATQPPADLGTKLQTGTGDQVDLGGGNIIAFDDMKIDSGDVAPPQAELYVDTAGALFVSYDSGTTLSSATIDANGKVTFDGSADDTASKVGATSAVIDGQVVTVAGANVNTAAHKADFGGVEPTLHEVIGSAGNYVLKGQVDGETVYFKAELDTETGAVTKGAQIAQLDTSNIGDNAQVFKLEDGSYVAVGSENGAKAYYSVQVDDNGGVTLGEKLNADPLASIDAALQQVDSMRSDLGAIQNRFQSTITNLANTVNNLSAARSRIEDADYAVEVSNMTRAQILQQAGTSVLAQANQVPQTVLSLLR